MAIVRKQGKPDLFITFTANVNWREIQENLNGCLAADRPDIVVRVFNLKLKELIKDITKRQIFGKVVGHVHVVEFQKRGLPHAHILIILSQEDKLRSCEEYDEVVWAEIPDKNIYPMLFFTITSKNFHGPCGEINPNSVCLKNGICEKQFPKLYNENTTENEGYPIYKRSNNGVKAKYKNYELDNRWIVPFNAYLSTKFDAHINAEVYLLNFILFFNYFFIYIVSAAC
jgi:hypothetical protein